jgi:hypothetical protein
MKNNISLNLKGSSAKRMEFFLNRVNDDLEEVPFNWQGLHLSDKIISGHKFISAGNCLLTITTLLCDSYRDAIEIAKVNSFPVSNKAKWSLNGDFLYIVESSDEGKVSDILSFFAGKE